MTESCSAIDGRPLVYMDDLLIEVWRLQALDRTEEARALLCGVWHWGIDALANEKAVRVALRLLGRLAPCTDAPESWAALPEQLVVWRAGEPDGFSWTLDRAVAERLAVEYDLAPLWHGQVAKADVLAYITNRGENEIIPRAGSVARGEGPP